MINAARTLIYTLIVTTTMVFTMPEKGWAMLAPSQEAGSSQRSSDMTKIQTTLESKIVRERLKSLGLTDKEIESRLGELSDQEVHKLAKDIDALNSGGFIEAVLVLVILVLLILFLIKRV